MRNKSIQTERVTLYLYGGNSKSAEIGMESLFLVGEAESRQV